MYIMCILVRYYFVVPTIALGIVLGYLKRRFNQLYLKIRDVFTFSLSLPSTQLEYGSEKARHNKFEFAENWHLRPV